jgi:hypothetical protein
VSQAQQQTFIPVHNSTCQHNATTWQRPSNGGPNFFQAIASTQVNKTAEQVCYSFIEETVWQGVIMYCNGISQIATKANANSFHEIVVVILGLTLVLPKDNPFHLYKLIRSFFRSFYVIPHEVASLWRLAARYRTQSKKPQPSTKVELNHLEIKKNILFSERPIESSNPNMECVLRIEHLLLPIAASLHYSDLVSLGQTSRAVREAVFPCQDMIYRKGKLRAVSCQSHPSKTKCWNCFRQICEVRRDTDPPNYLG